MTLSSAASRSVLTALLLGFVSATACIDESLIEDEDCLSDDDCFSSQTCVKTGYQAQLPEPTGWCRPKDDLCVPGRQPGCSCEIAGLQLCCFSNSDQTLVPHLHPDEGCICVLEGDTTFVPEADVLGGCIDSA